MLALLPVLLPSLPPAVISVGTKLMMTPGVLTTNGIDSTIAMKLLSEEIKTNPDLANVAVGVVLKGLGVQEPAVKLTQTFLKSENVNDQAAVDVFKQQFHALNTPQGNAVAKLPFGCVSCRRIHTKPEEVRLSASNKPLCARCGREINL